MAPGPHEIFPGAQRKGLIKVLDTAEVRCVALVSNPTIQIDKLLAYTTCAICRCVIRDDQFKVLVILSKQRLQCLAKEMLFVVDSKPDANRRFIARFHSFILLNFDSSARFILSNVAPILSFPTCS